MILGGKLLVAWFCIFASLYFFLYRFEVSWTGKEGLDVESHADYIKDFCNHFYQSILRLVDDAVKKVSESLKTVVCNDSQIFKRNLYTSA